MDAQQDTNTLRKLRPLGALEKYKVARSELGIYYKVAVTAIYTRTKDARRLKPALFHALTETIVAHPFLSAIPVAPDGPTPSCMYFAQLPSIDLASVVIFADMTRVRLQGGVPSIDAFLEEEHSRPFQHTDPPSPCWRLYVFADDSAGSDFIVTFFFHHCIADTLGALVFHETLEAALSKSGQCSRNGEPCTLFVPPPATLPPALDDFLSDEEEDDDITRNAAAHSSTISTISGDGGGCEWSGTVQFLPVRTRYTSHWLSADTTHRLLSASKAENVSLTAALQSMLAAALFRQLPLRYTKTKVDCAMSLRPWLPPSIQKHTLGVYTDGFSVAFERGPGPLCWADAVGAQHAITRAVAAGCGEGTCASLRRVADMTAFLQAKLGYARPSALELSNIGRMAPLSSSTSKRDFEIRSLLFSQSAGAGSGAVKVSAVTGRCERLALGFSWQEGALEGVSVGQLIRDFDVIVRDALL